MFGIPDEDEVLDSAIKQLKCAVNALEGPSEAIKDFPKANPAKKRHRLCPDHAATLHTILQNFGSVKRSAIVAVDTWKLYMSAPSEEFLKAYKKFRKASGTERKALKGLCLSWDLDSERAMVEELRIPKSRDLTIRSLMQCKSDFVILISRSAGIAR